MKPRTHTRIAVLLQPNNTRHTPRFNLETFAAIVAVVCFCFLLWLAGARAGIPFEMNYSEGHVLAAGARLLHRSPVYPDPASFPYGLHPYGPVAYLLTAAGLKLFGLGLFAPRLIVLAAAALAALTIAWLACKIGGRWRPGILMGTLFLAGPLGRDWLPLLRVDYWAILFSLLGLSVFVGARRFRFVAVFFFWLALLVKITALAAPLACTAELVLQRNWKKALAMGAATAGIFAALLFYPGNHMAFHLFRSHPEPYDAIKAVLYYGVAAWTNLAPLALLVYFAFTGPKYTLQSRPAWLYLAACSFTILSTGNPGSDSNHLLEWSAALCLVAALTLSKMLDKGDTIVKPLVLSLAGLVSFFTWQYVVRTANVKLAQQDCAAAYAFVRSFPGDRVLSEDVSALVLGGKTVLVSDVYAMTQQGTSLPWQMGAMEELAARRYFDLILLRAPVSELRLEFGRWSPALMETIQQHYRLERKFICGPCLGAAYVPR